MKRLLEFVCTQKGTSPIILIFRKENVKNVKWVWTTNVTNHGEGDWALNTSQAAVDAWKAGIKKMKAKYKGKKR